MSAKRKNTAGRIANLSRMQRQAFGSFREGDLDRTERLCAGILEYRPQDFDALHLLGLLNFQRRRLAEALRFLSEALKINSGSVDAMSNLGLALDATGRHEEAIASYREALRLAPDHPEILYNFANACLELGRTDEALSGYDSVLAVQPVHVGALVNRGNALQRLNQPVRAIASYDEALAAMPGHPQILTNRGHALRRLDRPVEALADFEAALAAAPEFPEAHFEAAMTRLSMGDFDAGWKQYEWRWKTGAFARHRRQFQAPLWLGETAVAGKTILLHAEQGFGDTIQFIRYAPLLAGPGRQGHLRSPAGIAAAVVAAQGSHGRGCGEALPAFDLHCPLLSLPLAFGTRLETIPAPFHISPRRRSAWRIGGIVCRRVALVPDSSGRASRPTRTTLNRSIALARLSALFENPPLQCLSLQTDLRSADGAALSGLPDLVQLGGFRDFADTAAVISLLDIVVSVDTAVAHLAGALGKPVVILLPLCGGFSLVEKPRGHPVVSERGAVPATCLRRLGQRRRSPARPIAATELTPQFAGYLPATRRRPALGFR